MPEENTPVFVDLDKTLIRADLLHEGIAKLITRDPLLVILLVWVLITRGKSGVKEWVAKKVSVDPSLLPYRPEVLSFVQEKKKAGKTVILATASDQSHANLVASYLGLFDGVVASDGLTNLKGERKLEAIKCEVVRLCARDFEYLGDSLSDVEIFAEAKVSYLFSCSSRIEKKVRSEIPGVVIIGREYRKMSDYFRLLRPHQWSKNSLLALPACLSYEIGNASVVKLLVFSFISFSLASSAVYVLNDFCDVDKDRAHPRKRFRPLAYGSISSSHAFVLMLGLLSLSLFIGMAYVGKTFAAIVICYLFINLLYCLWLKTKPILDIVLLSIMYIIRLYAGGVATHVAVSDWLFTFGLFFFLSLALGKRYQELAISADSSDFEKKNIRGYLVDDRMILSSAGLASGLCSVLVIALYIRSEQVTVLYRTPELLWLLCPCILYWIFRFWIITARGEMHDDPIVFAVKDKTSYVILLFMSVVVLISHAFEYI